jgi:hypothetical protein
MRSREARVHHPWTAALLISLPGLLIVEPPAVPSYSALPTRPALLMTAVVMIVSPYQ